MSQEITTQNILAARIELPDLALELANDFFSSTWQASHIRLVELVPDEAEIRIPLLLAHILSRNPAGEYLFEEWLPNACIHKADRKALAEAIAGALEDLEEAQDRPNELLTHALLSLSIEDAQSIHTILSDDPSLPSPRSAYEYGPTDQFFWVRAGRFYYLELHHES